MSEERDSLVGHIEDLTITIETKQNEIDSLNRQTKLLWDRIDELATKLKHSEERGYKLAEELDRARKDYKDLWTRMDTDYMKLRQAIGLIVSEAKK